MKLVAYERVIQWVSGPFAVFIGAVAAKWVSSWGFLGSLGLQKSAVAHAIAGGVVFIAASGVTYAAHAKWLANLPKWWTEHTAPTVTTKQVAAAQSRADTLRAQLRAHNIEPEV